MEGLRGSDKDMKNPDIDIDTRTDFDPTEIFPDAVRASRIMDGKILPHPCGYYLQNIPQDSETDLAAIPYQEAEELGWEKIDFLHLSIYDHFESRHEIEVLLQKEPNWDLLKDKEVVGKLFQLSKHWNTVRRMEITTIEELAAAIALIRPGPVKANLLEDYLMGYPVDIYRTDNREFFKRSHAIAYAHVIWLQLHLIEIGVI